MANPSSSTQCLGRYRNMVSRLTGASLMRRAYRISSDVIGQSRVFSRACTRSSSVLAVM